MSAKKYIVWSNFDLDIDDGWREAYAECAEINRWDYDPDDEYAIYEYMVETNAMYLDDERMNLDIEISRPIIAIADLGLWNGRFSGYKELNSTNINACLDTFDSCEYHEWYVDEDGDLRCRAAHHNGTNYVLYRAYKDDVTESQIHDFHGKIYDGVVTQEDIDAITRRLGDEIANVYGWEFNKKEMG
jgi:hypothetical protein